MAPPRSGRSTRLIGRVVPASLVLIATLNGRALAQDTTTVRTSTGTCVSGAPRPACSKFWIAEIALTLPLARSLNAISSGAFTEKRPIFDKQLEWQLGVMHNLDQRWAIGPAVGLGTGSNTPITSLTGRARLWITPSAALDVSAGKILRSPGRRARTSLGGARGDVRINLGDDIYLGVRSERLEIESSDQHFDGAKVPYATGTHRSTSLLLGLGTEWAMAGTGFVAAGLVAYWMLWLIA